MKQPSEAELDILTVLWDRGPSTVRQVFESLAPERKTGYTTILKLMQIMAEKELVTRHEEQRAHIYEARLPREKTQRQLLGHLMQRAFGGSVLQLVQQALGTGKPSPRELREIRKMLDGYERDSK